MLFPKEQSNKTQRYETHRELPCKTETKGKGKCSLKIMCSTNEVAYIGKLIKRRAVINAFMKKLNKKPKGALRTANQSEIQKSLKSQGGKLANQIPCCFNYRGEWLIRVEDPPPAIYFSVYTLLIKSLRTLTCLLLKPTATKQSKKEVKKFWFKWQHVSYLEEQTRNTSWGRDFPAGKLFFGQYFRYWGIYCSKWLSVNTDWTSK